MSSSTDTLDEESLVYAAGFLDGEGCFTVGRNDKITVTASNSDQQVIEWLKHTFGGSVTHHKRLRKPHHSTMYSWSVVSRDALRLLLAILPYLRVKTDQAIGLILLQNTMSSGGKRISPEIREERDRITLRVKELKHATKGI